LKNPNAKKGWWNGSRCRPWVQTLILQKQKQNSGSVGGRQLLEVVNAYDCILSRKRQVSPLVKICLHLIFWFRHSRT
jgi:hypothetical protein